MTRRFRSQIIESILNAAQGGSIRTTIQLRANLTTEQFDHYVRYLVAQGLISTLSDSTGKFKSFRTTPKGVAYLSMVNTIHEMKLTAL
jgi:predicted transcriptional regulator